MKLYHTYDLGSIPRLAKGILCNVQKSFLTTRSSFLLLYSHCRVFTWISNALTFSCDMQHLKEKYTAITTCSVTVLLPPSGATGKQLCGCIILGAPSRKP